jgi:hypothetical protein
VKDWNEMHAGDFDVDAGLPGVLDAGRSSRARRPISAEPDRMGTAALFGDEPAPAVAPVPRRAPRRPVPEGMDALF